MNIKTALSKMAGIVLLAFAVTASAQPLPPQNTNTYHGGTNVIDLVALEAAQQAVVAQDYLPWVQQDDTFLYLYQGYTTSSVNAIGLPVFTGDDAEAIRIANLNALAAGFQAEFTAEQAEITAFIATNAIPLSIDSSNASSATLRRIENGSPVYMAVHDLAQAQTMAVPVLWTNGASGLNLNGEGTLIGEFDAGNLLTNHQEFGPRIANFDPTVALAGHSTHVAGVMAAAGVNTNATGMSPKANIRAYPFAKDTQYMPILAGTNHVQLSNHSYGLVGGWYGYVSGYVVSTNGVVLGFANNFPVWLGNPAISKTVDTIFGSYNTDATNADAITYAANAYLPVFSAGNSGGIYGLPNGATNGAANGFYCPS